MCCGHHNKKQPDVQVTFLKLNFLQIKETSEKNNCSFKTSNGDVFQLLWQNSTQPTFVDSVNRQCLLRTLRIWEHILNHLFSVLFVVFWCCWVFVYILECLVYIMTLIIPLFFIFCILSVGHTWYSSVSLIVLSW